MKKKYIHYITFTILLFCAISCRATTGISVQYPPENAYVENELINMVLNVEKNIDKIRVVSSKNKPKEISVRPGSNKACFGITLNMGMNTVDLLGLDQGKVVDRKEMKIFFRSDLFPKFREAPAGFERYFFHFIENEKSCASCHDMEPTLSSLRPATPEESPCYSCHAKKREHTFAHYPLEKGICFSCHEVLQGNQKYIASKPDEKVCYTCHSSLIKEGKKKKIRHGPTGLGHCTLCHNPHGSEWPSLMRMHTTDLCTNCHEDKASGAHVIAGFFGKGHPVRGVKDPFNPDREFTCAGCHNPHAGDTKNLLNHDNSTMTSYCSVCHKM
ncbi:MAG: hypothetical protein JKY62_01050 [Desulfocapsa sp.]|uniref:Doubled CXXCH motif domain-containing protein n=1 Tax=Desulfotalea psychrophila TaxID=84980 RepID=A0ABS3AUP0_9BACT|nr:hypothetical protein [Desulfocapsa sp.]MBN4068804.1 hypothetical protein [Desulfotalea psychrophila]